jgi:hypothetical protein
MAYVGGTRLKTVTAILEPSGNHALFPNTVFHRQLTPNFICINAIHYHLQENEKSNNSFSYRYLFPLSRSTTPADGYCTSS